MTPDAQGEWTDLPTDPAPDEPPRPFLDRWGTQMEYRQEVLSRIEGLIADGKSTQALVTAIRAMPYGDVLLNPEVPPDLLHPAFVAEMARWLGTIGKFVALDLGRFEKTQVALGELLDQRNAIRRFLGIPGTGAR